MEWSCSVCVCACVCVCTVRVSMEQSGVGCMCNGADYNGEELAPLGVCIQETVGADCTFLSAPTT